jgi:N-acetylneuraminate synthase
LEGNDHKVSLLPDEFAEMIAAIRQVEQSMGTAANRSISQGEMMNREVLSKSLIVNCSLKAGDILRREDISISSPGVGIQPDKINDFIGTPIEVDKLAGSFLFESDFQPQKTNFSISSLDGNWGVPVRYHDINSIISDMAPPLVEIHLSYHDLALNADDYLTQNYGQQLVIHAPELFIGDHTLDLCSVDEVYRKKSIDYLQEVIDLSEEIYSKFPHSINRSLIVNVGGFSEYRHFSVPERRPFYTRLKDSLRQLNKRSIEILPQTMPPYPWHFGGQRFHNIMMDENEIIKFCQEMEMRICLDVSHTKLATQFLKHDFCTAIKALAPYAAHLHLADAKGLHGEGLQINDGEIDWPTFMDLRASKLANVSFIVEIWQGHKNKNFGAKKALYRLQDASQIGTGFPVKLFENDSDAPVELVHKENMKINRR